MQALTRRRQSISQPSPRLLSSPSIEGRIYGSATLYISNFARRTCIRPPCPSPPHPINLCCSRELLLTSFRLNPHADRSKLQELIRRQPVAQQRPVSRRRQRKLHTCRPLWTLSPHKCIQLRTSTTTHNANCYRLLSISVLSSLYTLSQRTNVALRAPS
jgi:hypothetical protein